MGGECLSASQRRRLMMEMLMGIQIGGGSCWCKKQMSVAKREVERGLKWRPSGTLLAVASISIPESALHSCD